MGCRVFRIGVFFDGTGNNKFKDGADGSLSNIAKLFELYQEHQGEVKTVQSKPLYSAKIYKEGIGTDKDRGIGDDFIDRKFELGGGGGGAKRIQKAIDELIVLLDSHADGEGADKYCERIIDVFGFSRGAAQARDFINTFYEMNNETLKFKKVKVGFVGIYDTVGSFGIAGNDNNMKPLNPEEDQEDDFNIWQVGNGSYGLSDNLDNTRIADTKEFGPYLDVTEAQEVMRQQEAALTSTGEDWRLRLIPKMTGGNYSPPVYSVKAEKHVKTFTPYNFNLTQASAEKIVHMVSDDEVRYGFPLTSSLPVGGHEEFSFLGVHSDIGGGYPDSFIEPHSYTMKTFIGGAGAGRWLSKGKKNAEAYAAAERAKLPRSSETYNVWRIKVEKETFPLTPYKPDEYHVIAHIKRRLTNGLAKVTLNIMYEKCRSAGVPLKPIPSDKNHKIPDDLVEYYEFCRESSNVKKSHYAELKNFIETLDTATTTKFRSIDTNYRHHSGVDPAEIHSNYDGRPGKWDALFNDSPDGTGGNDVRYVSKSNPNREINPRETGYEGELITRREIFPNIPSKAIAPS